MTPVLRPPVAQPNKPQLGVELSAGPFQRQLCPAREVTLDDDDDDDEDDKSGGAQPDNSQRTEHYIRVI